MKTKTFFFALVIILPFFFFHCDSSTTSVSGDGGTGGTPANFNVTLTGFVREKGSGTPLDTTVIRVQTGAAEYVGRTDSDGKYILQFTIDSSRIVTMILSKTAFITDTVKIFAIKNATNNVSTIFLSKTIQSTRKAGPPAAIHLLSQSVPYIGVRGSGSPETAQLTFQVVDSLGNAIDASNSSLVKFKFGGRPDGGEFFHPDFIFTDTSGTASVFLTSGTKAGVVQFQAEITLPNKTIRSIPVGVTIHGGLPDITHFGIAAQFLNIAGYDVFGVTDNITAYLGDKYANPVRPNTSVYFTTTGGIIQGSAQSGAMGTATAVLMSAEPRPVHPTRGAGFATVTASTADENQRVISNSMDVLFSGVPFISISPSSFDIPNGGSQTFNYQVRDENNNPLVGNTNITVTVEGDNVKSGGETNVLLPDTQSPAWTRFSFFIYDTQDTINVAKPITVKITSTGGNGNAQLTIRGTSR